MRLRTLLLIVAAALMAIFVLLNWQEFTRPSTLSLGWQTFSAPLGLVMLGLLALATAAYLIANAAAFTRNLMDTRQHHRALQAQRDLAERAEASRFTDLRTQLESHLKESRLRETNASAQIEQTVERLQRELRNQVEQMQRAMSMRMGEMEARLESRLDAAVREPANTAETQRSPVARNPDYLRAEPVRAFVARGQVMRQAGGEREGGLARDAGKKVVLETAPKTTETDGIAADRAEDRPPLAGR